MDNTVLVTGHSGAGKTTKALAIAKALDIPKVEVDDHPLWESIRLSREVLDHPIYYMLRAKLAMDTVMQNPNCVIEGQQLAALPLSVLAQFKVVLIDPPKDVIMRRRINRAAANYYAKGVIPNKQQLLDKQMFGEKLYAVHEPSISRLRHLSNVLVI